MADNIQWLEYMSTRETVILFTIQNVIQGQVMQVAATSRQAALDFLGLKDSPYVQILNESVREAVLVSQDVVPARSLTD